MGIVGKFSCALRTGVSVAAVAVAMTFTASVDAGVLNGHASAYNDGNGPAGGAWTGTTAFNNGVGVSGTVDWTVFGPGDFPYAGYAPTAGELTYAFQVYSTGTAAIHSLTMNDINAGADNIGSFADLAGETPTAAAIGSQIEWNFAGLDASENSIGLAFSSIKTPQEYYGMAINGGSFSVVLPLPIPGPNDIPEPAALVLFATGSLCMIRRRN